MEPPLYRLLVVLRGGEILLVHLPAVHDLVMGEKGEKVIFIYIQNVGGGGWGILGAGLIFNLFIYLFIKYVYMNCSYDQ